MIAGFPFGGEQLGEPRFCARSLVFMNKMFRGCLVETLYGQPKSSLRSFRIISRCCDSCIFDYGPQRRTIRSVAKPACLVLSKILFGVFRIRHITQLISLTQDCISTYITSTPGPLVNHLREAIEITKCNHFVGLFPVWNRKLLIGCSRGFR